MAVALETAIEVKPPEAWGNKLPDNTRTDRGLERHHQAAEQSTNSKRVGVFLCRCGGSISSAIDFKSVTRRLTYSPGVICVEEIAQACTEDGAKQIAGRALAWQLDCVVLAACRCCNSVQVCYSCTDRRLMCQQHLYQHLILLHHPVVEFCNIREQCAWVHQDDPRGATNKAVQLVRSAVTRARMAAPLDFGEQPVLPRVLILGGGLVGTAAARALASLGYQAELVAREGQYEEQKKYLGAVSAMVGQLPEENLTVRTWPEVLKLQGYPGNYEAVLVYGSQSEEMSTGAILMDMEELEREGSPLLNIAPGNGLLGRIISRSRNSDSVFDADGDLRREITVGKTDGIYLLPHNGAESPDDKVLLGLATAARVSYYLEQANIGPRAMAVNIDGKMCRGCGDCADVCPYIEMREREDGTLYAYIDRVLCLGCGVCIATCPTGAIDQLQQSDQQIIHTLRSMLQTAQMLQTALILSEV